MEKKGGRPRKKNPTETQIKPSENPTETQYKSQKNLNDNVNDNVNDNINVEIVKYYEENIGLITPATAELLLGYLEDMDYKLIIEAIKIATLANKRNGRYINGILKDWNKKGYKVLADLNNEKQEKNKKQNNKIDQREYTEDEFENLYANQEV